MRQIYILDKDTNQCAQYYCNKDILLKILEFSDMLCVAHQQVNKGVEKNVDIRINWRNYFAQNEACFVWARETVQNYRWLADLAVALCSEYTYRYEKNHNYEDKIKLGSSRSRVGHFISL